MYKYMSEWKLSGARFTGDKVEKTPFTPPYISYARDIDHAIRVAAMTKLADPQQSKYVVGGGIGYFGQEKYTAGNTEYGLATADHMEQRAKATHEFNQGKIGFDKPAILAIVVGQEGGYAGCCGNCRDVLRDTPGAVEHLTIVNAFREGGDAIVYPFKDLLVDAYPKVNRLADDERVAIHHAIEEAFNPRTSFDIYSQSPAADRRRYVLQIGQDDKDLTWGHDSDHAFHTTTAAEVARIMMRLDGNPFFDRALFIGEETDGSPPDVLYRDRQALLAINLDQELLLGQEINPRVTLATYNKQKEIAGVWHTTVKDMLPLPFTPKNFGPDFMAHLKQKTREFYEQ